MDKCSCCKKNKYDVTTYRLPNVGYGSLFDTLDEDGVFRFKLCSACTTKINKWVAHKLPDVKIEDFWKCEVVLDKTSDVPLESFKYEDTLFKLFMKFMPDICFGTNYIYYKYKLMINDFIHTAEKKICRKRR